MTRIKFLCLIVWLCSALSLQGQTLSEGFTAQTIPDSIWQHMQGRSYQPNPHIQRADLRYLRVLHYDYDGRTHQGELVCNKRIASNTSCFCYRAVSDTKHLSKHAYGLAIDVNPLYNPYVRYSKKDGHRIVEPATGVPYVDRKKDFRYKITTEDLCYKLFIKHGFTWGGAWRSMKDYQHFEYRH